MQKGDERETTEQYPTNQPVEPEVGPHDARCEPKSATATDSVLDGVVRPFTVHEIMQHLERIFDASGLFCHGCICSIRQRNGDTGGPHVSIQDDPVHLQFGAANHTLPKVLSLFSFS